jgi:uncharacterized membrane protein
MPVAVLACAVLFDIGAELAGFNLFGVAAYWNMAAGLLVAVIALVVMLVDLVTAPVGSGSRELVGLVSASLTTMVVLFAIAWSVRSDRNPAMSGWLLALELIGLAAGAVGAWFAQGVVIGRRMREPVQVWLPISFAHEIRGRRSL